MSHERHYAGDSFARSALPVCGEKNWHYVQYGRDSTTCAKCLRSLAKRDRAFQKTARNWYGIVEPRFPKLHRLARARIAEEAIAREEGRAP